MIAKKDRLNRRFNHVFKELPFWVLLGASTLSLGSDYAGSAYVLAQSGGWFRPVFFGLPYVCSSLFVVGDLRSFARVMFQMWAYVLMVLLALASVLWSTLPSKVLINCFHYVGLVLVSFTASRTYIKDGSGFYSHMSFVFAFIVVLSVCAVYFYPGVGLEVSGDYYVMPGAPSRWKGVTSHANSLGAVCSILIWSSLFSFVFGATGVKKILYIQFAFMGFMVLMFGCRSMTSIFSSLSVMLSVSLLAFLYNRSSSSRLVVAGAIVYAASVLAILIYVICPDVFEVKYFFKAIGRSPTLTGRSSLWSLAYVVFQQKPFIGWSFDSIASVLSVYGQKFPYGQFHNGYIDLLVRGGLVAIVLLCAIIGRFAFLALFAFRCGSMHGVAAFSLLLMVLISNIAEASFFREGAPIWMVFCCMWVFLELFQRSIKSRARSVFL